MKIRIVTGNIGSHTYEYELKVTSDKDNVVRGTYKDYSGSHRITAERVTRYDYKGNPYTDYEVKGKNGMYMAIVED